MIEFIRKRLNSVFVLLLLGVLVASFAFFGIGDVVQVGQGDSVARVGDRRITIVELARAFENFVDRQKRENPEVTAAVALRQNIDTAILRQLIQQALLIQSAENVDITASPEQTKRMVAALPIFQINGKFDVATYKSELVRLGVSEDQVFDDMARQQIVSQIENVLADAAIVPKAMADAQISVLLETRTADAILVPIEPFEAQVSAPTDEDLDSFFNTVRSAYRAPEYRSFRALYLTPSAVADEISVSDADVAQAYALRKTEFGNLATLDLQLVTFDTREAAAEFKAKAINSVRYVALAEATGANKEDINLGTLERPEIENLYGAEIADALFALPVGDVSEPLEGPFGFQVFRLVSKTAEKFECF
ncbi:MAG: peptidylprolyl isomerase, partial [Pseudomonadota bacterium]